MSRRLYLAFVLLAAAATAWLFWPRPAPAGAPAAGPRHAPAATAGRPLAALPPRPNPNPPAPEGLARADAPSELADQLNSPATNIHADLRLIHAIFVAYRGAVHGLNPIGDNADITAVLTGRNALGFAFIPPNHPAINANGELCDRWGTPFFFHQISGEEMGVRSAGPDRKLWTADDEVLNP